MEHLIEILALSYIAVMSLAGFISMGIDKKRAIKKEWRIPERTLIIIAFLGGGIGSTLSMFMFRHKTKHIKFVILLPMAAMLYIIIIAKLTGLY